MSIELKDTSVPGVRGNIWRNKEAGPSMDGGDGAQTLYESFQNSAKKFPNNPCIGYRPIDAKGNAGPFQWFTYKETQAKVAVFASGIVNLGLAPKLPDFPGGLLGFYAKNRWEWTVGEQACYRQGVCPVPLYDTLGMESVAYVLDQTLVSSVICTSDVAVNMLKAAQAGNGKSSLRNIVLMDTNNNPKNIEKVRTQALELTGKGGVAAVKVYAWADVEAAGKAKSVRATPPSPKDVAFFCYTSGTTGDPKGALITHVNMICGLAAVLTTRMRNTIKTDGSVVHLSYLPLPHVYERLNQMLVFGNGGRIGYYQGDPLKILDDLVALRPTLFPSVPRLLSRIYDKITAGVEEAGGVKKTLFFTALNAKLANLNDKHEGQGKLTHPLWDRLVFGPLKKRLGLDRVEVLLTGSAPLSPQVMSFLRVVFGVPVIEGYGQTEGAAIATATNLEDYTVGHVGVPSPACELALFDVPEMGYLSTDKVHKADDSKCQGRGEICIRGVNVFKGYYKMPDKTAETIDADGWLHSGDIGVITADGKLRIVDRKKNIFKLSQGEYVAAEKIENIYSQSPLVMTSFVYGDSLQSMLVAIVVPDPDQLKVWAAKPENKIPKGLTLEQLCALPAVNKAIFDDMNKMATKAQLKGFEFARAIHIEPKPFNEVGGNLLTPTFKLKRQEARDHYRAVIDKMYEQLNAVAPKAKL